MLKKYFKSKVKTLGLFLTYLAVFCLVAWLYGMPLDGLIYACLLCLFFAAVFMTYSYFRYSQKVNVLRECLAVIEFGTEEFPLPTNAVEEQYQEMIRQLHSKMSRAISERDKEATDMIDYYTLWAHQIKTPIAAMRLLLQSETPGMSKDAMQIELFKIEQYVEMVLQYLRLGSDTTDFVIKEQSLDRMVREAIKKYSTVFIKKKISLDFDETNCTVVSDEKWLTFVIEQILSNALKYTPSGGRITIRLERSDDGELVALVIEDNGIGIQKEDLPRVFDRGYTGYNGRTDKKSTGIGLYLCRQIMEKLGHTLSIDSEVGHGTCVKLGVTYKSVRYE